MTGIAGMAGTVLLLSAGGASSFTLDDHVPKKNMMAKQLQPERPLPQLQSQSQLQDTQEQRQQDISSSVLTFPGEFNDKTYDTWSKLSQLTWSKRHRGLSCELTWKTAAPTWVVVDNLLDKISPWFVDNLTNEEDRISLHDDIHHSIATFQDVCSRSLRGIDSYKVKVSARYGPTATQCPAWHADNVPMRWIQTMYGPGCCYIHPDDAVNNKYIQKIVRGVTRGGMVQASCVKTGSWKEDAVKKSGVTVQQTVVGNPVVLIGRLWSDYKVAGKPELQPVLHRSPLNIPSKQGRVLLTLDVITTAMKEEDECNEGCCEK